MKPSRIIKKPEKFGEWEDSSSLKVQKTSEKEKLWDIENVIESRGEGCEKEVLVKWADWEGPPSWVKLAQNPELKNFLEKNSSNPESCTLHSSLIGDDSDIQALRQALCDSLGEARRTPDGAMGLTRRVAIKLPFRKAAFQQSFGQLEGIESTNVSTNITLDELRLAIGEGFDRRGFKTSTETFINSRELLHLSWGYKGRMNYSHAACARCNWEQDEKDRPELCDASEVLLLGPPWLTLTFTRGRKNNVTGNISKRRKLRK